MSAHRTLNDLFRAFDAVGPGQLNDPGDAGTITVGQWGQICSVVTAGASETRTLARPTKPGILCAVAHDTDGGDFDLTVTGGYNADADTAIAFEDAGDLVVFYSVKTGTTYQWTAVAQEGTDVAVETGIFDAATITALTLDATLLTVTGAELNQIDGAILAAMTPGSGIVGTATAAGGNVVKVGPMFKTEIFIDLTGLNSGTAVGDIIGKTTTANCHIGQITAAKNGTIVYGQITCIETPAGGDPDVDFYGTATEATGTQDAAVSGLTGEALLLNNGDWTGAPATPVAMTTLPGVGYLYMVDGGGTAATYSAGIFLIELWGK